MRHAPAAAVSAVALLEAVRNQPVIAKNERGFSMKSYLSDVVPDAKNKGSRRVELNKTTVGVAEDDDPIRAAEVRRLCAKYPALRNLAGKRFSLAEPERVSSSSESASTSPALSLSAAAAVR